MNIIEYILRQKVRIHRFKRLSKVEPWQIDLPNEKDCKQRAFLIGTCVNGNLGDQAISYNSIRFIKECLKLQLIEVNVDQYWHQRAELIKLIRPNDIIFIQGGGNIGDEYMGAEFCRRDLLKKLTNNTIISLPQTVSFSETLHGKYEKMVSKVIYAHHKQHIIFAREKFSYEELKILFPSVSVQLAPDIVLLYSDYNFKCTRQNKALLCLREDCEGIINSEEKKSIYNKLKKRFDIVQATDTFVEKVIISNRRGMIEKKLQEFASAKLIITDRLHGMVMAALSGTPCVVLPNYNHKVQGVYQWIQYLGSVRFVENVSELENAIDAVLSNTEDKYDASQLKNEFEQMKLVCLREIQ